MRKVGVDKWGTGAVRFGETGLGNVALFLAVLILLSKLNGPRRQSGIDGMHTRAQLW
jgi:hypothetical protein